MIIRALVTRGLMTLGLMAVLQACGGGNTNNRPAGAVQNFNNFPQNNLNQTWPNQNFPVQTWPIVPTQAFPQIYPQMIPMVQPMPWGMPGAGVNIGFRAGIHLNVGAGFAPVPQPIFPAPMVYGPVASFPSNPCGGCCVPRVGSDVIHDVIYVQDDPIIRVIDVQRNGEERFGSRSELETPSTLGGPAAFSPSNPQQGSTGKPEAGKPEAGKPKAGKPEAGKPEAGKPETGKPETGKPETGKPEAGKSETGKPETGKPEAGKPETGKPEAGKSEAGKSEAGKSEAGKPEATETKTRAQLKEEEKQQKIKEKEQKLAEKKQKELEEFVQREAQRNMKLEKSKAEKEKKKASKTRIPELPEENAVPEVQETGEAVFPVVEPEVKTETPAANAPQATTEIEKAIQPEQEEDNSVFLAEVIEEKTLKNKMNFVFTRFDDQKVVTDGNYSLARDDEPLNFSNLVFKSLSIPPICRIDPKTKEPFWVKTMNNVQCIREKSGKTFCKVVIDQKEAKDEFIRAVDNDDCQETIEDEPHTNTDLFTLENASQSPINSIIVLNGNLSVVGVQIVGESARQLYLKRLKGGTSKTEELSDGGLTCSFKKPKMQAPNLKPKDDPKNFKCQMKMNLLDGKLLL